MEVAESGPSRTASTTDQMEKVAAESGIVVGEEAKPEVKMEEKTDEQGEGQVQGEAKRDVEGQGDVNGNGVEGDVQMNSNEDVKNGEQEEMNIRQEEDGVNGVKEEGCETLYLQNLNEKVPLSVMKETLATLFKPYRPLLPVIAHRSIRMRGQAFISFSDRESAAKAKKDVNEFPLYGKAISISFARSRADSVVSKLDGKEALEAHKQHRLEQKKVTRRTNPLRQKAREKLKAGQEEVEPLAKKPRLQVPDEYLPPNNVLFIQNLPDGTTSDDLRDVFGLHPGLLEIRTIPSKRDIAFIEFVDEAAAGVAKDALHNFKIDGETKMKVTYAKK